MRQFQTVFAFTFRRQTATKGWRGMTFWMALILFLLPTVLPVLLDRAQEEPSSPPPVVSQEAPEEGGLPETVARLVLVDEVPGPADWPEAVVVDSLDAAVEAAGPQDLIVHLTWEDGWYDLSVLLPEETTLTGADASAVANWLRDLFPQIQIQKAGLTAEEAASLALPVWMELEAPGGSDDMVMTVLQMVLPFLTIMLLYFMVLFYGQSVANSAIAEKSSKLMDTFLVSVKPQTMMLGKVLAISLAAVLQLSVWLLALGGGVIAGATLLRTLHPDTTSAYLAMVDTLGAIGGLFSPAAVAVAVAIMLAGFLLYCALAAVGGALASKPEELSSTNVLFTMALVISFFCCLYGGGMMGEEGVTLSWLDWVPFTAILATPSRVLLGQLSPLAGLGSLALVLATALVICLLAGRVYQMMSFYRGAPPTPRRLLAMLRNRSSEI